MEEKRLNIIQSNVCVPSSKDIQEILLYYDIDRLTLYVFRKLVCLSIPSYHLDSSTHYYQSYICIVNVLYFKSNKYIFSLKCFFHFVKFYESTPTNAIYVYITKILLTKYVKTIILTYTSYVIIVKSQLVWTLYYITAACIFFQLMLTQIWPSCAGNEPWTPQAIPKIHNW